MRKLRHVLAFVLVAAMLLSCVPFASAAEKKLAVTGLTKADVAGLKKELESKDGFSAAALQTRDEDEIVRAIVLLAGDGAAEDGTVSETRAAKIVKQHTSFKTALKATGISYTVNFEYSTLLNGFSVSVRYGDLAALEALSGVKKVYIANTYDAPIVENDASTKQNNANTMSGADLFQNIGIKGEGMLVAVLDTGLNLTHEAFQNTDILEPVITEADTKAVRADAAYVSAKIPFAYDYYGYGLDADGNKAVIPDNDVTDHNGHGTHVAGTVGGYVVEDDGAVTFSGVAPAAQIAVMKIFADVGGGTSSDIYFAALEDAYLLGADVVNMSIGAQNGFTYDRELENEVFGNIYETMDKAGIILSVAAGNEYNEGYMNNLYYYADINGIVTADYADYGTVASPSTYGGNLSVAAIENIAYPSNAIQVDGVDYGFSDTSDDGSFFATFAGKELEYVMVPNVGDVEDYEGLDVNGKVAVVARGTINFSDKLVNAANAGAIAMICYNNTSGQINMSIDNFVIPAVSVLQVAGEALAENTSGKLTVLEEIVDVENPSAWLMCDFSNMGTTGDLKFKPQITAVGGHVYSSVNTGDSDYEIYSGTSMAAPNSSGNFALLLQLLYKVFGRSDYKCYVETYSDLDANKWYHEYIDYVLENGLMSSTVTGKRVFAPEMTMTRSQVVQILYAAAGKPAVTFTGKFADVAQGKWYADAVEWAAKEGIVAGVGDGTNFAPDEPVTREQIATILYAAAGKPAVSEDALKDFSDSASVSGWARNGMNWAVSKGLISGKSNAGKVTLAPKDVASRAEFAVIIMRHLNGSFTHETVGGLTKAEAAKMAEDLAESTADLMADNDYVLYSPRKQGAGMIDLASAISTRSYIVDPLIELGDDPERTGVYEMEFVVKNLSEDTAYYKIDGEWQLVDYVIDYTSQGYGVYNYVDYSDYADTPTVETNWENDIVTVPAESEVTVKVKLTLNDNTREQFEKYAENGAYVEGYVVLWEQEYDKDSDSFYDTNRYIHASYLGFYGDWTDGSILETTDSFDVIDYTYAMYEQVPEYLNAGYDWTYFFESNLGANETYIYNSSLNQAWAYLGDNAFFYQPSDPDRIAISNPTSDADMVYSDSFASQPMQLRNARHLIMTVTDAETGELYYVDDTEYLGKAYYEDSYGIYLPQGTFMWDATDADGKYVANGTKVHVNYYANLPYGEDTLGAIAYEDLAEKGTEYLAWSYDVLVDTEGPSIDYTYDEETKMLTLTVSDNHYLSRVYVYDEESSYVIDELPEQTEAGQEFTYELDLSDMGEYFIIDVYDYALNNNYVGGVTGNDTTSSDEDMFSWLSSDLDDYTGYIMFAGYDLVEDDGDYYYNNFYFLDASGTTTGTAIKTNAAVVDGSTVFDYSTDFVDDGGNGAFINVPGELVYEVVYIEPGRYAFKMFGTEDTYLCYGDDGKNSLTTCNDLSEPTAQWTITFDENGYAHIVNYNNNDRVLLYNTNNADVTNGGGGFFRCYNTSHYPGEVTDYNMYGMEIFWSATYSGAVG